MNHLAKLALLSLTISISACSSVDPIRMAYTLPEQVSIGNWKSLEKPGIDSFKVLNTGEVKVPLKGMLNTKKLPDNHEMPKMIWVDVFVFLFHHTEKGWFMIDTGLDSTFQEDGNISGILAGNYIKASKQAAGQNIAAQLVKEDVEIQGIFLTHLHGDHTAGLPEIAPSIHKIVGKGEEHLHYPILYHSNHLSANDTLFEMDWANSQTTAPFSKVLDVFGDQSFFAISTPGHSNSHTSYLLNTTQGLILLTGDASHTRYGFENNVEPGWISHRKEAVKSLAELRAFYAIMPETKVIFGHQL